MCEAYRRRTAMLFSVAIMIAIVLKSTFIATIFEDSREWLRRQGTEFCPPGYRLVEEHTWQFDGQEQRLFIFEPVNIHRVLQQAVILRWEDGEGNLINRKKIATKGRYLNGAIMCSSNNVYLELVYQTRTPQVVITDRYHLTRQDILSFVHTG